ncbi:hypothetical protein ACFWNK_02700 [Streptomyces sp. NPDC058417]|uniref:hypothetical protein n=1 Tax=unclassified Streptomyces TaxID=2593676 RepID=UPI00365B9072
MAHADHLLVDIAERVESEHNSRMSLTVVIPGAVITGRLAPESLWKQRVAEVLKDSAQLGVFSSVFTRPSEQDTTSGSAPARDRPTHLHFHVARILQGTMGIPDSGGMYRVALEDVSAWTVGDLGYSDQ